MGLHPWLLLLLWLLAFSVPAAARECPSTTISTLDALAEYGSCSVFTGTLSIDWGANVGMNATLNVEHIAGNLNIHLGTNMVHSKKRKRNKGGRKEARRSSKNKERKNEEKSKKMKKRRRRRNWQRTERKK
jgi:hypothetical protein